MKLKDLKIKNEYIPDWILGIKDSMQLDSGQEACSLTAEYNGETINASVRVYGDVRVLYKDGIYKCASQFPEELLDFFAGKRPDLAEEVDVVNNNWFELVFNDDSSNGFVVDDLEEDTKDGVRQWLLDAIIDHLFLPIPRELEFVSNKK